MVHIIRPPQALWRKRGKRLLATSAPRLSSQFFPTKICAESSKRLHRSLTPSSCQQSAANARLRRTSWQKFYALVIRHSPTPPPSRLLTHSIKRVPNRIQFFSRVHYISPVKRLLICAVSPPHSKNARSDYVIMEGRDRSRP